MLPGETIQEYLLRRALAEWASPRWQLPEDAFCVEDWAPFVPVDQE